MAQKEIIRPVFKERDFPAFAERVRSLETKQQVLCVTGLTLEWDGIRPSTP